ncbi:hypothetical protein L5515_015959 [Caenorhabditis briggsae]|uniref:Uncharacterized protein n=1 Tax=Caenorhabditis briggsae TaxID=6238 RepID=A0AAE9EFZ0_CAEBR|nr:hypothetical protein L5515_015959 [Caenorhabditis briggsae]
MNTSVEEEELPLSVKNVTDDPSSANFPFIFKISPEKLLIPKIGHLDVSLKPTNKDSSQYYLIMLDSYLFEIVDPRGRKQTITQLFGFSKAGEEIKFKIGFRDVERSSPGLIHDYDKPAEGSISIKHWKTEDDHESENVWKWRFVKSKIVWRMDGSGGDLKLDLLLDNEDDEEVKKRKKKFEDELKIMKNKKLQTGKAERTTEGLKTSKGDSEDNTKEKTADKTQENSKTSEEKPEKKVSEKVPEKIPERIPEKVPEKVPEKPDKSKKSQAKSVKDPKPNPERSVIQTSNYPKSVYENMDPNVHIPVGVDKTPPDRKMETQRTPMKDSKKSNTTKKKNPCCSIL